MPYTIHKNNDHDFTIVNKGNGQTVSHHDTYKRAVKAVKAIYANEKKGEWHQWFK